MSQQHTPGNPDAKYLALRADNEDFRKPLTSNKSPPTLRLQSLRNRGLSLDERLLLETEGRKYLQAHYQHAGQPTVREWELLVTGWLAALKMREELYPKTTRALNLLLEDSNNPNLDTYLGKKIKPEVSTLTPVGKRRRLDETRYTFSRRDSVLGDQALSGHIDDMNGLLRLGSLVLAPEKPGNMEKVVHVQDLSTNREVIESIQAMEEENKVLRAELDVYKGVVEQLHEHVKDMQYDLRPVL